MSSEGRYLLNAVEVATPDRSNAPAQRCTDTSPVGIELATGDLRSVALRLDQLLNAPSLTAHQSFHLLEAAHSAHRALLALEEIRLPVGPSENLTPAGSDSR